MRKSTGRSSRATVCAPAALALPAVPSSLRPTAVVAPAPGESAHPGRRHRAVHLTGDRAGRTPVVVAYGCARYPLCGVTRRDGFRRPNANRRALSASRKRLRIPPNAGASADAPGYGTGPGAGNGTLSVRTSQMTRTALRGAADPAHDVMNSGPRDSGPHDSRPRDSRSLDSGPLHSRPRDFGRSAAPWPPYRNTAGGDSAVFGPGAALRSGGVRPLFRFTIRGEGHPLGALFVRTGSAR